MAEILNFEDFRNPKDMTREELTALLERLRAQIAELDAAEPEDMESEEYEVWGETHEDLEDQVDEILDLLDDMK